MKRMPLAEVVIDLSAIRHNAAVLARRAAPSGLAADLAADGYGHGIRQVALAAIEGGAGCLAVSHGSDTRAIRGIGVGQIVMRDFSRALPKGVMASGPALYGLDGADPELKTAMRVSATVVGTKTIEAGESVSYGYTYTAAKRTNLALVGIGYADGVDRSAGNIATVRLGGRQRPIAGRVAMNVLVLELGADEARVGDIAVLFGDPARDEPAVSNWAGSVGRLAAEVTSVLGAHLPRRFV